ncbi:hypothetical protein DICPUDRAFT_149939 [Dictyostelium purpureum]|uniref:Uncharacterized protein n=1 Tax=Dictyostelium purpureum TaxID=5786 RepID=F0ZF20_DICPU|nr:uncharacterized protein DICPUDRAFT_149939 [Dictyostelium purpureum]EGC37446.1 hypothetical protein DICPUDRAFT_149939 [Dictyostelium purpureum]|eukprot:XP_003286010.1 hypothetical protein DICPUDRAFT_149939 [Dictyostelium purpureum]
MKLFLILILSLLGLVNSQSYYALWNNPQNEYPNAFIGVVELSTNTIKQLSSIPSCQHIASMSTYNEVLNTAFFLVTSNLLYLFNFGSLQLVLVGSYKTDDQDILSIQSLQTNDEKDLLVVYSSQGLYSMGYVDLVSGNTQLLLSLPGTFLTLSFGNNMISILIEENGIDYFYTLSPANNTITSKNQLYWKRNPENNPYALTFINTFASFFFFENFSNESVYLMQVNYSTNLVQLSPFWSPQLDISKVWSIAGDTVNKLFYVITSDSQGTTYLNKFVQTGYFNQVTFPVNVTNFWSL